MDWSDEAMVEAGMKKEIGGRYTNTVAIMRYVAGVVKRERVRLAKVMHEHGERGTILNAIVCDADDAEVFKWAPPAGAGPSRRGKSDEEAGQSEQ